MQYARKRFGERISARREVQEQNRLRDGFERKLRAQVFSLFSDVGQAAREEYERTGKVVTAPDVLPRRLKKILDSHYRAVIDEFGLRVLRSRKGDSQFETLIQQYIRQNGASAVQNVSSTVRGKIRQIIATAEAEGPGVAPIGRQISDAMSGGFSRNRAATIARTETHNAASYASLETAKQLSIPNVKKQWVSVNDPRTRSHHSRMNGTQVEMDEDFTVPYNGVEYKMERPGDPRGGAANVINCRCVLIYVTPEDEVVDDEPKPPEPTDKPTTFTPINPQALTTKLPRDARSAMRNRLSAAAADPRYHQRSRFRGRSENDYGKLRGHEDSIIPWLEASVAETEDLAKMFNVPQLRGTKRLRRNSRALMDMGDGVLGVNDDAMGRYLGELPREQTSFVGFSPNFDDDIWDDIKGGRAFNTLQYMPTGYEKFRAVVFHEFGHQVHQMYRWDTKAWDNGDRVQPPIEAELTQITGRKGPSVYADTNSQEWFAENFALYFSDRQDMTDPKFQKLIERMMDDAY
jgi:SPP1 gp7 family putative phage head morphogenesis protein